MLLIIIIMGCDFSWQIKEYFKDKSEQIQETEDKIRKKINRITNLFDEFNATQNDGLMRNHEDLITKIENIENLIEALKEKDINKFAESLCLSSSSDDILEPIAKIKVETKKLTNRSPSKLYTTESILDDPEIEALISKNRNKFLRKCTGS